MRSHLQSLQNENERKKEKSALINRNWDYKVIVGWVCVCVSKCGILDSYLSLFEYTLLLNSWTQRLNRICSHERY